MSEVHYGLAAQLNDFDPAMRQAALEALLLASREAGALPPLQDRAYNLHGHTFYSYNGYGLSPVGVAWAARSLGLWAAGIVDFDVLDGVDEFLEAAARLGLKGTAGIETRVFVPDFADAVINSPGEPGIAYHMGVGFTTGQLAEPGLLPSLRAKAQQRNRSVLERCNAYLAPVTLDYARDVLPLTPAGNPTERHLCAAYELAARSHFGDTGARAAYWAEKLGLTAAQAEALLADPVALQGAIRAKTMKRGGAGYVQPEPSSFPTLEEFNAFVLNAGAIPTCAWLDGTSEGEGRMAELLDLEMAAGTAALNIIPDRNWNIADATERATKVQHLHDVVALARERGLPVIVGTEMNAPGQRYVDDFEAEALRPLVPAFVEGARIVFAHTVLERAAGMGYLSAWAQRHFANPHEKNAFYAEAGRRLTPEARPRLSPGATPEGVMGKLA